MTKTEAPYYERDAADVGSIQMLPYDDSPWYPLYDAAAALVDKRDPVVDLGCGAGAFAQRLAKQYHQEYLGIDFCQGYIEAAKERMPNYGWQLGDLRGIKIEPRTGSTVYTCLEVLEHLKDDLALVRSIPPGYNFVFSVPNYPSESHVRSFADPRAVWKRYDGLLNFWSWRSIDLSPPPGRRIHLLGTRRRPDAWR